jgi:hypothetical protein
VRHWRKRQKKKKNDLFLTQFSEDVSINAPPPSEKENAQNSKAKHVEQLQLDPVLV